MKNQIWDRDGKELNEERSRREREGKEESRGQERKEIIAIYLHCGNSLKSTDIG